MRTKNVRTLRALQIEYQVVWERLFGLLMFWFLVVGCIWSCWGSQKDAHPNLRVFVAGIIYLAAIG